MAIKTGLITLDGLKYNLDDRDRVAAQLVSENNNTFTGTNTHSGTNSFTGTALSVTQLPSLNGMTATAQGTSTTLTAAINTVHINNFTGAAAQTVTLCAATVGARVVYHHSVDTTGGTALCVFDCAGSDVFTTGQIIESRSANVVIYDTSIADETQIRFTPANEVNNFISQGSMWYFWCTTAGYWNMQLNPVANPAGTGLVGACLFLA